MLRYLAECQNLLQLMRERLSCWSKHFAEFVYLL